MRMNELVGVGRDCEDSVPKDVDAMLDNWGRWCTGRGPQGECFSLEGNYRAKGDGSDDSVSEVDIRLAIATERAMRFFHPHSAKLHQLLKAHYVLRQRENVTCRKLGIYYTQYDHELKRAALMVRNRVDRMDVAAIGY